MVRAETLGQTLVEMTKDTDNVSGALEQFLSFVKARNLFFLLPDVLEYLERQQREDKRRGRMSITTARKVSLEVIGAIKKYAGADDSVPVDEVVDENLIAGFQAIHNDKLYDASLRTRVDRLREQLSR